jgi:hypothetical protein
MAKIVFGIVFLVILSFIANLFAQRLFPTSEQDADGRRYGYNLLVQFIGYGGVFSVVGVIYLNRDTLLGWSNEDIAIATSITLYIGIIVGGILYQLWDARQRPIENSLPEQPQPPLPSFVRKNNPTRQPTTGA